MIGYWHDITSRLSVCPSVCLLQSVPWRSGSVYRGLIVVPSCS